LQENDKPVLLYSTFPSEALAEKVGADLVNAALCACVNIIPGMTSLYRWQGNVERAREVVMIVKTMARHSTAVTAQIKAQHPNEVPAIVVLPVTGGLPAYIEWLDASC
jgi:periplasmic divalent cation tolerance protein